MSLSRPTAYRITRKFSLVAVTAFTVIGLSAGSASAKKVKLTEPTQAVPAAACATQAFSQPFLGLGDSNFYTPVPGAEFNSASEGWDLKNGATIIQTTRPDGTQGGALDLPSGSIAVSPPVCVTLLYPTARVWEKSSGEGSVSVAVAYVDTKTATKPKTVGALEGASAWSLSEPFEVRPELGGKEEGTREARFVFVAGGDADSQLYGLYVDPRMR